MIAQDQVGLDSVITKFWPAGEPESARPVRDTPVVLPRGVSESGFQGSDAELMQAALRAKNGPVLQRLLDGDASGHGGNRSGMDQALANILAFWSQDEDQVVRLMLTYGPVREKWTDRLGTKSDYLRNTVRTAIRDCERYYGSQPAARPGTAPADDGAAGKSRFEFFRADAFFSKSFEQEFLIGGILVRNQPGVIAGPSKGMKTSLMTDMAISLATGTPFLGEYPVLKRVRVAQVSGESGGKTTQETARRVCAAKGVKPDDLTGWWSPCFDLPRFNDPASIRDFAGELVALKADVVFIDPVYLCIDGKVEHANLFEMGPVFRVVAAELLAVGCTPVLVHHANRGLQSGTFMELRDLSYAGLEQFARQWVLVNRQRAFRGDGVHDLLVAAGGSAGHSTRLSVRVEEGTLNDDFTGRTWNVTVESAAEAAVGRDTAKQAAVRKRDQDDEEAVLKEIDSAVQEGSPAATRTYIRRLASTARHLSSEKLNAVLGRLIAGGRVESIKFQKPGGKGSKQEVDGFRRTTDADGRIARIPPVPSAR